MTMKRIGLYMIGMMLMLTSCGDFLEEYSQSLAYANSCTDLDELLVGECYMKQVQMAPYNNDYFEFSGEGASYFPWLNLMDDDTQIYVGTYMTSGDIRGALSAAHYWEKNPYVANGVPYKDGTWSRLYAHIGVLNVILSKVDEFANDLMHDRVKGEVQFLRAAYYYWLVNLYAKPYQKSTASVDPGVPLKLTEYVEDIYFARNSVEEVYAQIVKDLEEALKNLAGENPTNVHQAGEAAALALLSRVYLYMERWEECVGLCDQILKKGYTLIDLNTYSKDVGFTSINSPETIFTQGTNVTTCIFHETTAITNCFMPSKSLYESYDAESDLRRDRFFYIFSGSWGTQLLFNKTQVADVMNNIIDKKEVSDNSLIRLAEIYLNKAEALAMLGSRDAEAASTLQELRLKRYATGKAKPVTQTGKELVELIRKERRLELCFEGHRWFDLRRYAVHSKYPYSEPIEHKYFDKEINTTQYRLLKKYSENEGAYVLPIPADDIIFNSGVLQQNEREERPILNH